MSARASGQEAIAPSIVGEGPTGEVYRSPSELKKLSLQELVDVEITSSSRRPEPISQASSAIDVITGDTIRRSGVTNLPDALRLGAGMEVAQIDGHTWAISARGFNISTANKLQVLLDGRSLYTPLFSGVFWDVQRTFLPDLEQIEVIRGPGATLWGANAVNGVINIRTKSARDTQGFLLDAGGGSEGGNVGLRYGGRIGRDTYYRAYVMTERTDSLSLEGGGDAQDGTDFTQGGFRIESALGSDDTLTLQGDGYAGAFGQLNAPDIEVDGGNLISRWVHQLGVDSSLSVQGYYDRTHRLIPGVFEEHRDTFDIELEGRFVLGAHDIVYGGNYRISSDEIGNLGPTLAFLPTNETEQLVSAYVQDEWHIIPRQFSVVAGSKFEYNTFSNFEVQPSGRLVWTPTAEQTLWGAISRAVRTPTRIDQDLFVPNPSTGASVALRGTRDFESEVLVAYELGYRVQPSKTLSLDLSLYYNDYDNLRSQEPQGPTGSPIILANMLEGQTYGATLGGRWRVTDWWELDGNVSGLHVDLHRSPG
ncbi:MAG: TonB-dependent receptor, partial [Chthoniobacterales bacterium]